MLAGRAEHGLDICRRVKQPGIVADAADKLDADRQVVLRADDRNGEARRVKCRPGRIEGGSAGRSSPSGAAPGAGSVISTSDPSIIPAKASRSSTMRAQAASYCSTVIIAFSVRNARVTGVSLSQSFRRSWASACVTSQPMIAAWMSCNSSNHTGSAILRTVTPASDNLSAATSTATIASSPAISSLDGINRPTTGFAGSAATTSFGRPARTEVHHAASRTVRVIMPSVSRPCARTFTSAGSSSPKVGL